MARRKRRGERYIDRWLKEHPRVTFYMSRGEYDEVKRIADSKGLSLKDLVLEALRGQLKLKEELNSKYEEGYNDGYDDGYDEGRKFTYMLFIDDPWKFYDELRKLKPDFEPMLFTSPCYYCGKPMIFTHKLKNLQDVRRRLEDAFRTWYHGSCKPRM